MNFDEISDEDGIVIAFSGGADSRYLLQKIWDECEKGKKLKKNIVVAHFNHHMRESEYSESQRDENFSREISEKLGFVFELGHWKHSLDLKISENSARNARYDFLQKICKKYSAKYIFTAHHKDDQAETVFLQFVRGGGINALTGMRKKRRISENCYLYRPLLGISKSEILEYLLEKKIKFVEDSTNSESVFTRNFIRNEIFPLIEKKFPNFSSRIAEKSQYFQMLQDGFEKEAQNFLESNDFSKGVERKKFLALSSPVQFEIIKTLIAPKFCDQKLFSEISGFIKNSVSGKKFLLKNVKFEVFGEQVWCIL